MQALADRVHGDVSVRIGQREEFPRGDAPP